MGCVQHHVCSGDAKLPNADDDVVESTLERGRHLVVVVVVAIEV